MWFGEGLDPADPVHDAGGDADSLSPHGRAVFPALGCGFVCDKLGSRQAAARAAGSVRALGRVWRAFWTDSRRARPAASFYSDAPAAKI